MNSEQRDYGSKMFAALANPAKLHILEHLAKGAASVNEITEALGLKQSMTSQHLASLHSAGVVVYEKVGNSRLYRLRGARITRILELVEEFYEIHLSDLHRVIAQQSDTQNL
ncbi:MAG: ArsR/SmtB family transcription factor [Armatimonadota bacterium]